MSDHPKPTACPECDGWGHYFGHNPLPYGHGPRHMCERCWGTGVIDCTCPGACRVHPAHTLPGPARPWLVKP